MHLPSWASWVRQINQSCAFWRRHLGDAEGASATKGGEEQAEHLYPVLNVGNIHIIEVIC
jgi:hypothetical protein